MTSAKSVSTPVILMLQAVCQFCVQKKVENEQCTTLKFLF